MWTSIPRCARTPFVPKTLLEHIELYLEWKSSYTSRAPAIYRPWLLKFAQSIPYKRLEDITLEDVVRYRKSLDVRYSPYTIQLAMVTVHNFLKFQNIQRNDCLSAGLVRVPRVEPNMRPVVLAKDYERILGYFKGKTDVHSQRNQLIIQLLWDTGMRVSELCDINVSDIDLESRELLVRTRKSFKMRQIFWSPETHAVLKTYLTKRNLLSTSSALLVGFGRTSGGRLKPRSVQRIVEIIAKDLNLGKLISPHSFRHGKAHRILRMGGNPKHVSAILGHSETNPMAAYHYLKLDDRELKDIAKRFLKEDTEESVAP